MCTTLDSIKTDASKLDQYYIVSNGPKFGILSASSIASSATHVFFFIITYNYEKAVHFATYRSPFSPKCQVNSIEFK